MSIPFRDLIDKHCGGVRGGWDNLYACIPGGSSVPVMDKATCEVVMMDFDDLKKTGGSSLGTAAVTVFDKSVDMISCIRRLAHFYHHESCGQCTPCREGTGWLENILTRVEDGTADKKEIPMLEEISRQIEGHTICALGDAAAWPVQGLIRVFGQDMTDRIDNRDTYDPQDYHQPAWPGLPHQNQEWVKEFSDGSHYTSEKA